MRLLYLEIRLLLLLLLLVQLLLLLVSLLWPITAENVALVLLDLLLLHLRVCILRPDLHSQSIREILKC